MKVCIVTPDLAGPVKNGGIGTFCVHLSELLCTAGYAVTIILTCMVSQKELAKWQKLFAQKGIALKSVDELKNQDPFAKHAPYEFPFLRRSRRIAEYLDSQSFDLVHFQDWQANGFHAIRLRRTGLGLAKTRLFVTLHSPSKWLRQGMNQSISDAAADHTIDFAERYCCENADRLISPTQHMLDWAESEGWKIEAEQRVVPYPHYANQLSKSSREPDPSHVIFFGRLETRKGLGIFLEGLSHHLEKNSESPIRQVTFLGKPGRHENQLATGLLQEWARHYPQLIFHFELEHGSESAIRYIMDTGGIALLPSLLDNCPLAIIECIEHKIPFMAARSGGIAEIVHRDQLFDPDSEGIENALHELQTKHWDLTHPYNAAFCKRKWLALHSPLKTEVANGSSHKRSVDSQKIGSNPRVSVCIPYHDLPEFLPQTLQSIDQNNYKNIQVVVCDDGSSTGRGKKAFEEQERQYGGPDWLFIRQENQGVGRARNRAAAQADGDYLVFMDADNVACPDMLEVMVRAMQHSRSDAMTCYFKAFSSNDCPRASTRPDFIYRPIGAAVPTMSLLENTFGDANCILKRSAFQAVDGFRGPPLAAYADWDLFLRLHLTGFRVDLIPRELFWYRHRPNSMLRTHAITAEHDKLLELILLEHPHLAHDLAKEATIPLYRQLRAIGKQVGRDQLGRFKEGPVPWHKHIYRRYRRIIGDPRYQKKTV